MPIYLFGSRLLEAALRTYNIGNLLAIDWNRKLPYYKMANPWMLVEFDGVLYLAACEIICGSLGPLMLSSGGSRLISGLQLLKIDTSLYLYKTITTHAQVRRAFPPLLFHPALLGPRMVVDGCRSTPSSCLGPHLLRSPCPPGFHSRRGLPPSFEGRGGEGEVGGQQIVFL